MVKRKAKPSVEHPGVIIPEGWRRWHANILLQSVMVEFWSQGGFRIVSISQYFRSTICAGRVDPGHQGGSSSRKGLQVLAAENLRSQRFTPMRSWWFGTHTPNFVSVSHHMRPHTELVCSSLPLGNLPTLGSLWDFAENCKHQERVIFRCMSASGTFYTLLSTVLSPPISTCVRKVFSQVLTPQSTPLNVSRAPPEQGSDVHSSLTEARK